MQKAAELMISMIKSALNNEEREPFYKLGETEAKKLFAISAKHDMAHIISAVIDKNSLLPQGSEARNAFSKQKLIAVYRREQLNREEEKICTLLESANIDHIPLKGAVIRRFYPEQWMRTSCDIDILIKEKDLDNAIKLITEKLYYSDCGRDFHDHHLKSQNGVHLELHFSLAEKDDKLDTILNRVWEYSLREENFEHRYYLTNEFLLFQTIAHTQYHFISGGCGVRPLIDLWLLENKLSFSAEALDGLLKESGSYKFYSAIKRLISVWFEGNKHSALTSKIEKYILAGGVFGTKSNRAATGKYKKGGKTRYIISRIFMPKSDLEIAYPKLKEHPLLLPYYEVRRWFALLNRGGVSNIKSEFGSNGDISDMLKELGF